MKKILISCVLCLCALISQAQVERPKLLIGLAVDQMRWDYLYYYYNEYGEGGFKRLLNEGFSCEKTLTTTHQRSQRLDIQAFIQELFPHFTVLQATISD